MGDTVAFVVSNTVRVAMAMFIVFSSLFLSPLAPFGISKRFIPDLHQITVPPTYTDGSDNPVVVILIGSARLRKLF